MRVSTAALALLLGGTSAFVPSNFVVRSKTHEKLSPRISSTSLFADEDDAVQFPTPKVTSDTPISNDSIRTKNIMEARGCLLEVEAAAEQARDYLAYLEEVAEVIRAYLEDQDTPLRANLKEAEIESVERATEYLTNIERATDSAIEYLGYLEEMAQGIKTYLGKFEEQYQAGVASNENIQRAEEAKICLTDLEETAESAREYLVYLQDVAGAAQQYLVDLHFTNVDKAIAEGTQQPVELKTMQDFIQQPVPDELGPRATRSIGTHPKTKVVPPPSPALEVDTTSGPTPVKRIEAPPPQRPMEAVSSVSSVTAPSTGSYLESLQPPDKKVVSSGSMSYLDSIASGPKIKGVPKAGGTIQGYLDSIAPSTQTKFAPRKASGGYLDNINNPPPLNLSGSTPTSHFKESASSTPFAEVGPPGRGRSDVSHMDSYDTGNAPAAGTMDSVSAAPPTTGSYLDQMSPAGGIPKAAAPKKTSPTTSSYLDRMSSTVNIPPAKSASTSDEVPSTPTEPTHRVRMVPTPKASTTTSSYLDQMSSSAAAASPRAATPPPGATKAPGSYLDQIAKPSQPVDWSQAKSTSQPATPAPPAQRTPVVQPSAPMSLPSMTTGGTGRARRTSFLDRFSRPDQNVKGAVPARTTGGIQQAPYINPTLLDRSYPTVNAPLRTLKKEVAPEPAKRETKRSSLLNLLASKVKKPAKAANKDPSKPSSDPTETPGTTVYDRFVKNEGRRK